MANESDYVSNVVDVVTIKKAVQDDCFECGLLVRRKEALMSANTPLVSVIMGSQSDWQTMKCAADLLDELSIPYEVDIVSAHRTPDKLFTFAEQAKGRGIQVIIAGAGGAAHLPGMVAAKTTLPVLGVPVKSSTLNGIDSLLSIVQMPKGVPVATFAIGTAGAANAAIMAASILANQNAAINEALTLFRQQQTQTVLTQPNPNEALL